MALGQASGGWTESSSALRIMHVGIRNTTGLLTDDAFTQSNPPVVTTQVSAKVDPTVYGVLTGVLSGSVAFTRPDGGGNYVGGPKEALAAGIKQGVKPIGIFINDAAGNAYENLPAVASGRGPYVCGKGTYGNALYETKAQANSETVGGEAVAAGAALVYQVGVPLIASRNGYLMPSWQLKNGQICTFINAGNSAEAANGLTVAQAAVTTATTATFIGTLKMAADSELSEIIYDQHI